MLGNWYWKSSEYLQLQCHLRNGWILSRNREAGHALILLVRYTRVSFWSLLIDCDYQITDFFVYNMYYQHLYFHCPRKNVSTSSIMKAPLWTCLFLPVKAICQEEVELSHRRMDLCGMEFYRTCVILSLERWSLCLDKLSDAILRSMI